MGGEDFPVGKEMSKFLAAGGKSTVSWGNLKVERLEL